MWAVDHMGNIDMVFNTRTEEIFILNKMMIYEK